MLASDVGIAVLAILSHEDGIRSFGPLSSEDVAVRECNPGTRVPENPGNPPGFKPVNPGLCAVKNSGFTGLI